MKFDVLLEGIRVRAETKPKRCAPPRLLASFVSGWSRGCVHSKDPGPILLVDTGEFNFAVEYIPASGVTALR